MNSPDIMQAFSTFSWVPDFMQTQHEKMACTKPHPAPVVRIPLLDSLKRKRTDSWRSPSPADDRSSKRQRPTVSRQSSAVAESATATPTPTSVSQQELLPKNVEVANERTVTEQSETSVTSHVKSIDAQQQRSEERKTLPTPNMTPAFRTKVIEKIEAQINLEILLKHNELRLIEQELAKCQVGLEQIRRCQIIPYPGHPESAVHAGQISTGTGPALEPAAGLVRPEHPAPWGVTDGPYTRHYARWLIPDAAFDAGPPPPLRQHVARKSVGGRSIRRTDVNNPPALSTRAPRASIASPLYALPSNYPIPKDRNTPLLATRPSDGKLVKLVCKFCGKDNVSSMQGFLNHCRIQHKHEYTSHGAAADDCGVVIEEGEVQPLSSVPNELPTPVSATTPSLHKPLVHPLIVNLPPVRKQSLALPMPLSGPATLAKASNERFAIPQKLESSAQMPSSEKFANLATLGNAVPTLGQGPFVPSAHTPSLSALLQRRGASGNLQSLVENARDQSDFDNICEQLPSDDEDDEVKPVAISNIIAHKPAKPREPSKPKVRRPSAQQSRASTGTTASASAPLRIKITTQRSTRNDAFCESPASYTPIVQPCASSTVDFANPNFGPVAKVWGPISPSPALPSTITPTRSEHSPLSVDRAHNPVGGDNHGDEHMLEGSSPHTVDTDPGLMSDHGDDEDDDHLTFATSSVNGEEGNSEAESHHQHGSMDIDVKVRRDDDEHDHHDHHTDGVKSPEASVGLRGREAFVAVSRGGRRGGRGRQRGGVATGTGRGKGGARRTKQDAS